MRKLLLAFCVAVGGSAVKSADLERATEPALVITEIMPKPTDAQNRGTLEGMDPNGLESGWVELEKHV